MSYPSHAKVCNKKRTRLSGHCCSIIQTTEGLHVFIHTVVQYASFVPGKEHIFYNDPCGLIFKLTELYISKKLPKDIKVL